MCICVCVLLCVHLLLRKPLPSIVISHSVVIQRGRPKKKICQEWGSIPDDRTLCIVCVIKFHHKGLTSAAFFSFFPFFFLPYDPPFLSRFQQTVADHSATTERTLAPCRKGTVETHSYSLRVALNANRKRPRGSLVVAVMLRDSTRIPQGTVSPPPLMYSWSVPTFVLARKLAPATLGNFVSVSLIVFFLSPFFLQFFSYFLQSLSFSFISFSM